MTTLSSRKRDRIIDDRKFDAYHSYIQAYNEWKLAHKTYGVGSPQEREAFAYVIKCQKLYNLRAKL